MSKELKALEKLNHTICLNSPVIKWGIDTYDHIDCKSESEFAKCYKLVERALDQKAKQEKEISALEHLCENQEKIIERNENELSEFRSVISENFNVKDGEETPEKLNEILDDLIKTIEKQEKILDILKKKYVIQLFTDEPWEQLEYKMLVGGNLVIDLTQEEYDLLKEWLNGTK